MRDRSIGDDTPGMSLLQEDESYRLLSSYNIPVPQHRAVQNKDEAVTAADAIGYPVVIKVISKQVIHKSDAGGVITGCHDASGVRKAIDTIRSSVMKRYPQAIIDGYLVAEHLPPGLELLIGGRTDPSFGKVITFGLGGIYVELIKDISMRILPVSSHELSLMIREIAGYRLLSGYRGGQPYDESFLLLTLKKIIDLFLDHETLVEFDLNPFRLYEERGCIIDARLYCSDSSLVRPDAKLIHRLPVPQSLLTPSGIAVVGASQNPDKIGYTIMRNMLAFSGREYPVNPKGGELFGRMVYRSLHDIPDPVDMVVVAVPSSIVPAVITDAAAIGARVVVIVSAGFSEIGPAGEARQDEIKKTAAESGMRLVGPNCLGIIVPSDHLNATFTNVIPAEGKIGFISQSGAVITSVTDWSLREGIGFSSIISVGNQADLDIVDYIRLLGDDEKTSVIIVYVEEIRDGKGFMEVAARVGAKKPIIALKSGSSEHGRIAARSHTGSLAGSYATYQKAFEQCGVIPVHGMREAFLTGALLAEDGYPHTNRAIIITNAGGLGVLASDYASDYGVDLISLSDSFYSDLHSFLPPEWSQNNPVDIIGDADIERFSRVFDICIRHKTEWDIAFVIISPVARIDLVSLAHEIIRFCSHVNAMIIGCLLGGVSVEAGLSILRKKHISNFTDLQDAFCAVGTVVKAKERRDAVGMRSDEQSGLFL